MVRLGNERQDGCGKVWTGAVRFGMVTNGRRREARFGEVRNGNERQDSGCDGFGVAGAEWIGEVGRGLVRLGNERQARRGAVRYGAVRCGAVRNRTAGMVR